MIGTVWAWVATSRLGRWCALAGLALVTLFAIFRAGKSSARREQEIRNLEDYRETRKKADAAADVADNDPRPLDERLFEHGALRD